MKKLVMVLALMLGVPAWATNYYVDGSATGCSGAPCSDSNAGTTEPLAWATPQRCISKPMVAGDTCYIKNGNYPRGSSVANLTPVYDLCGLQGASGNPITFAAYPGHVPVICVNNGAGACTSAGTVFGSNENCGGGGWSYTTVRGLYFQGLVYVHGGTGIVITGNDIQGGGAYNDGNCATIRTDVSPGTQIDHNYIHAYNTAVCPGASGAHSNQYITFESPNTVIEYNTFYTGDGAARSQSIALKSGPDGHIVRYNDLQNGNLTLAFQKNGSDSSGSVTGLQIYGNVIRQGYLRAENLDVGTLVYNNTFLGGGLNWNSDGKASLTSNVYNNIIQNPGNGIDCSPGNCNTNIANWSGIANSWANRSGYVWDYNAYRSGANFFSVSGGFGPSTSLASWVSAFGHDSHSFVGAAGTGGGPCTFTNSAAGDYTIVAATTCKTGACTNWPTCSTTTTEFGAYGVTSCVGAFCGVAPPDTTPPSQVTGAVAVAASSTQINVTWSAATDNVGVTGYRIERCVLAGCSPTAEVGSVGAVLNFNDSGLAPSTLYRYRVRAQDAATNYGAYSSVVEATTQAGTAGSLECQNWQTAHPSWIWCDDFEDQSLLAGNYYDNDSIGTYLTVATDQFKGGAKSLKFHHVSGQQGAGGLWRSFGRYPAHQVSDPTTDFQEVYWRFFIRHQSPWVDVLTQGASKLTRATMFTSGGFPGSAQGMVAHLWSGSVQNLSTDPVRCVSGTTVLCDPGVYNDFAHFIWEGNTEGTYKLTAAANVGQWHCVEVRAKLNTPGSSNGAEQVWIDGVLDINDTTVNFRDSYTGFGINALSLEAYINTGSPATQDRWIDNLVISRTPVGCAIGSPPGVCGNGTQEVGEACDDGTVVNNETACPYGTPSCTPCNSTCTGTRNLTGPYCQDGQVTDGEFCDQSDLGGHTCAKVGCAGNVPTCNLDCGSVSTSTCSSCGLAPIAMRQVLSAEYGSPSCTGGPAGFGVNVLANSLIVVAIQGGVINPPSSHVYTVTDNRGNVYREAVRGNMAGDTAALTIFYATNPTAQSVSVTVTDVVCGSMRVAFFEYTGTERGGGALDAQSWLQEDNSATLETAPLQTQAQGDLVMALFSVSGTATFSGGAGFVVEAQVPAAPNAKMAVMDALVPTINSSVTVTATIPSAQPWGGVAVAFRPPVVTVPPAWRAVRGVVFK